MQRRDFIRFAGAAANTSSIAGPLHAQANFPSQPIKLLLAFAAGGSTDAMFRVMADNASPLFGQTVIVEAKPGGGGTMAGQLLLQAKPDGYTLAQLPISVFRLRREPGGRRTRSGTGVSPNSVRWISNSAGGFPPYGSRTNCSAPSTTAQTTSSSCCTR